MILAELMKVIDVLDPTNAADSTGAVGGSAAQQGGGPQQQVGGGNGGGNGQTVYQPISSADFSAAALGRAVVVEALLRDGLPPQDGPSNRGPGGWGGSSSR